MLDVPPQLKQVTDAGLWTQDTLAGRLVLYTPPYSTVREFQRFNRWWAGPQAAPTDIDPDLALVIGDFGLVDDTPVLLDYRRDPANPCVLYLRWSNPNRWEVLAENVQALVDRYGLLGDLPQPPPCPKCVYCRDAGTCYCIRKGGGSEGCPRCCGSGRCHVCTARRP